MKLAVKMLTAHGEVTVFTECRKVAAALRVAKAHAEEKAAHLAAHALAGETITVEETTAEGAFGAFAVTLKGEGFTHKVVFTAEKGA